MGLFGGSSKIVSEVILKRRIFDFFCEKKLTLASAESCTGGIVARMLTDLPGSSQFYIGGVSSYSNKSKEILLGVKHTDIAQYGAVSQEVAMQMAEGIRKRLDADFAISITGIAGPDGGTVAKPVGTVWVSVAGRSKLNSKMLHLKGDRDMIRMQSAVQALEFLMEVVK